MDQAASRAGSERDQESYPPGCLDYRRYGLLAAVGLDDVDAALLQQVPVPKHASKEAKGRPTQLNEMAARADFVASLRVRPMPWGARVAWVTALIKNDGIKNMPTRLVFYHALLRRTPLR